MTNPHALIELKDVEKKYQMGDTTVYALRGVSLKIEPGEFVAIMGPSGSGKSTLMHILGLLDVPDSGSYRLEGAEVARLSQDELAVLRRGKVGFIFQQFNLLPRLTAVENAALPLLYSQGAMDEERAAQLLGRVGLGNRLLHRPNELSGGQQQRVAIARSLINQPRILFADEPTGNLDSASEKEILGILRELNAQGITVIMVTHEEEVGKLARRVIRMRDGVIYSDENTPAAFRKNSDSKQPHGSEAKPVIQGPLTPAARARLFETWEYFRQGFRTLTVNKVRTGLSMLGILIGVAAVVAMLALGAGAQQAIEKQLASLGSNLLVLRSGAIRMGGVSQQVGAATRLTPEDVSAIRETVAGVKEAAPAVQGRVQVAFFNKNWNTQLVGASPSYARMHASEPVMGRFFTEDEAKKRSRVAVIGATIVRELFGRQNPIGENIKVNRVNFVVIGILPEKGATGFRDADDTIIIPTETAMYRVLGKNYVDYIDIEIEKAEDIDSAQESLLELMNRRHKVAASQAQDAFQVNNMADIQSALTASSKTMSALLASIAAISLLVGGIGIMNIMLVSVTERTREIGLRKAIGARRRDILSQFLSETIVISVVGGLLGIALGWFITYVLSAIAGWATTVSPTAVFLAFFFSAGIGIVFGIYPAKKAAELHPIDALRYE